MTPVEHFREAEYLLGRASQCAVASIARQMVVTAQVHATLATCYQPDMYAIDCDTGEVGIVTPATTNERL